MKLYFKQTTILMGMCSTLGMYAPEVQASNGEANSLRQVLNRSAKI